MMNKRGISEIIATVLIVLIVVAAFVIVWQVVIPLVADTSTKGHDCLTAVQGVTITGGCLFKDGNDEKIRFQVSHGSKDVGLEGIFVIPYDASGNTGTKQKIVSTDAKKLPGRNEERTLESGIVGTFKERVSFALVVGTEECTASSPKRLTSC